VADAANEELRAFGLGFRLESWGDAGDVQVADADGRRFPAQRLSGGQLVLLAIALRVAINAAYAPGAGLLCLDEPTPGVSADNRGCLRLAVESLAARGLTGGLQIVLVTHDDALAEVCDTVVQLEAR
jgi:exonuclease SbcC